MSIVCGTDFSECAAEATAAAVAIASRLGQQEDVWLVHVLDLPSEPEPESAQAVAAHAEKRLQEHASRLQPTMPGRLHCAVLSGPAGKTLVEFAEAKSARLIVIAAQGHGASALYRAGGTAERVAQSAPVPVLAVRSAAPFMAWQRGERPLRILVGTEISKSAEAALAWLGALREAGPCDVVVGHVYYPEAAQRYGIARRPPVIEPDARLEQLLVRDLEKQVDGLPGTGSLSFRMQPGVGRLGDHLLALAEDTSADLIVLGTHHKTGLSRLASVSSVALRYGHASVACIPTPDVSARPPRALPTVERVLIATDLMFATFITLLFVPALYLAIEDVRGSVARAWSWFRGGEQGEHGEQPA